jgi:predicted PurR-regulated permease PerM
VKQPNWTRVLTILGVVLASFAVLYIVFSIVLRFKQALLLFILGGIVAYILTPLVNRLAVAFRVRAIAILLAYAFVAVAMFALGVLLFTPFIQQSQSLVDNLHNPSAASLTSLVKVEKQAGKIHGELTKQQNRIMAGNTTSSSEMQRTVSDIRELQTEIDALGKQKISASTHRGRSGGLQPSSKGGSNFIPTTTVPPSYIHAMVVPLLRTQSLYTAVNANPSAPALTVLGQATAASAQLNRAIANIYHVMSTNPVLLLHAQAWADDHNIHIDLASKFGQASQQLSNQGSNILNNAITIVSETANILLDTTLVLIISFYLLSDGGRMIRRSLNLVPGAYREQGWFFMSSLDRVLGGYIRGQLFLAALAGILGGGGAAVLGVPYPLLIGVMTFLFQLIPVIGPLVAVVPAVLVSLFFTPLLTTVVLLAWFLIFQQLVTNVLGPRIMGIAVGIHPLEALGAVLVGYPIGGLLGAFLAVPVAGVLHILVREAYAYFVLGHSLPATPVPVHLEDVSDQPTPVVGQAAERDPV